ncbi:MAG: energy-coupling factor ABC transporter permease [Proteobacteria bacterium]|nr:energy-coupling factor ABC transporter permease [Pseudomonadota bacterium]HQR04931.1 energy-coupling factor ABC transporter permease [Rhodocyclaceae bacterium]
MNFPDGLFAAPWVFAGNVLFGVLLFWSAVRAPWRELAQEPRLHRWLAAIVLLALCWNLKAGVRPGLNLHFLGVTTLYLMFGGRLALVALALILVAVCLNHSAGFMDYGLNGLVMIAAPLAVSTIMAGIVRRMPQHNLFVFLFLGGFFAAACSVLATGILSASLLLLAGEYNRYLLATEYLPFYCLLAFGEAWLNGAALTLMAVYAPHWLAGFDARRYLALNEKL